MKALHQSLVAVLAVSLLTACPGKQKSAKPVPRPTKPGSPSEPVPAPSTPPPQSGSEATKPEVLPENPQTVPEIPAPQVLTPEAPAPLVEVPEVKPPEVFPENTVPQILPEAPKQVENETAPSVQVDSPRSEIEEIQLYINTMEADLNEIKSQKLKLTVGSVVGVAGSFALASVYGMKANAEFLKQVEAANATADTATKAQIKAKIAAINKINASWVYDRGSIKSKHALPADTQFKEVTSIHPDGRGGFMIEMIKEVPVKNWKEIAVIRMQQPLNAANLTTDVVLLEGPVGHSQATLSKSVEQIRAEAQRIRQTTKVEVRVSRMTKSAPAAIAFGIATAVFTSLGSAVNSDTVLSPGNESQLRLILKQSREKLAQLQSAADTAAQ